MGHRSGVFQNQCNRKEFTYNSAKKKMLGVKKSTQNDFVYGELGRVTVESSSLLHHSIYL